MDINGSKPQMKIDKKEQMIVCGRALFYKSVDQELLESISNIKNRLESQLWQMSYGGYQKYKLSEIFKHMNKCSAQNLWLFNNNCPSILIQIKDVLFDNLTELNIYQNKINNIEALSYLDCKQLTIINLSSNNISQIRSMKKLSMINLDTLYLQQNPISEISSFTQAQIEPTIFKILTIHTNPNIDFTILKLRSKSLERVYLPFSIINEKKIEKQFRLRFAHLKINGD